MTFEGVRERTGVRGGGAWDWSSGEVALIDQKATGRMATDVAAAASRDGTNSPYRRRGGGDDGRGTAQQLMLCPRDGQGRELLWQAFEPLGRYVVPFRRCRWVCPPLKGDRRFGQTPVVLSET